MQNNYFFAQIGVFLPFLGIKSTVFVRSKSNFANMQKCMKKSIKME